MMVVAATARVPAPVAVAEATVAITAVVRAEEEADVAEAKKTESKAEDAKTLRITWVKSAIGYPKNQKATIAALGLRRLNQTVEQPDNPAIRGQIFRVQHLLRVEE